jgi:hypothetical protein
MANEIISAQQFAAEIIERARAVAATLDHKTLVSLAGIKSVRPGIGGGIVAFLAMAARERLADGAKLEEPGSSKPPVLPEGIT